PTFGVAEVEELLAARDRTPRQIDHLFVSPGLAPVAVERALDRERDGLFPSDHFGLFAILRPAAAERGDRATGTSR
ncbi:MAG: hypothetical protein R3190_11585, partial [Thermoanaerobaculia bacterium]|nr:hypothetical protein [Thermoanaerobaculia bacterium]